MIHKFLNHQEVKADMESFETTPIIVAGDFNCVSRLDYSDSAESLNYGRILEATPTHDIMIQNDMPQMVGQPMNLIRLPK